MDAVSQDIMTANSPKTENLKSKRIIIHRYF